MLIGHKTRKSREYSAHRSVELIKSDEKGAFLGQYIYRRRFSQCQETREDTPIYPPPARTFGVNLRMVGQVCYKHLQRRRTPFSHMNIALYYGLPTFMVPFEDIFVSTNTFPSYDNRNLHHITLILLPPPLRPPEMLARPPRRHTPPYRRHHLPHLLLRTHPHKPRLLLPKLN